MTTAAIIVTGLPASGKSTAARAIAAGLGWPMLDKDDFLERLYDQTPIDALDRRRALSRQADQDFKHAAAALDRVVLVSHWRPLHSHGDSGTATDWLANRFGTLLEVYCTCPWQTALARFRSRSRHPGHLDALRDPAALQTQFENLAESYPLGLSPNPMGIATDAPCDWPAHISRIKAAHFAAKDAQPD